VTKTSPLTFNKRPLFWLALAVLFFVFLFLIRGVLLPFVLGIFTAYFLDPAADRLERLRVPRGLATLLITAGFFLTIGLLGILIIPVLFEQLSGLIASIPHYIVVLERKFEPDITRWLGNFEVSDMERVKSAASDISATALSFAGGFITGIFQSGMAFVNLLSLVLITPVVAFYLLKDWDRITTHIDSLLPRAHASTIREQLAIIDATLAGFVRGQLNVCLILAAYYALALSLLGLKFGIIIGILTGFLVILPYVGFLFGMLTGVAVAFFQFDDIGYAGIILAIFLVGQVFESYLITPKLVGEKVGLHPVWIIFGMLAGAALFGFVGVLLAVPATAVIGVLTRFAIERYRQSEYYKAA